MTISTHSHESTQEHTHSHTLPQSTGSKGGTRVLPSLSVLAWPAWLRIAVVLPVVLLLWMMVAWANAGSAPW